MAASIESIQDDFLKQMLGETQVFQQDVTPQAMKREGTDDIDEFVQSKQQDFMLDAFQQTLAPDNFFPQRLDPQIYDNGTLYRNTPTLTYLEAKNRVFPTDTLEIKHLKMTSGFTEEWIDPANDTSGDGTPTVGTATASIKWAAVPVALSKILGMGASKARPQLMNAAIMALRQGLNAAIVAGDSTGTEKFDGLDTIAADSGNRTNLNGASMTVAMMDNLRAIMTTTLKSFPTFVLTNDFTTNQIALDMASTIRNVNTTEVVAGINPIAYTTPQGPIPIVSDPFVPSTATQRRLDMFNEEFIFLENFMTPSWVQKGTSKPLTEDGWMVLGSTLYNTAPGLTVQAYNGA